MKQISDKAPSASFLRHLGVLGVFGLAAYVHAPMAPGRLPGWLNFQA